MSDQDKPKLGMRAPLGLTRTVETGKVKQSFSHGRSNTVVVEVKRRRVLSRPGEEPQVEAPVEAAPAPEPEVRTAAVAAPVVAAPPPPPPRPVAPAPVQRAPQVNTRPLTPLERREQQERLLREAEEARMAANEENRRRDERLKAEAIENEKIRAETAKNAPVEDKAAPAPTPAAVEAPAAMVRFAATLPLAEGATCSA